MSDIKHTPGPWSFSTSPEGWSYTIHIHQADNATPTDAYSDVCYICQTCTGEQHDIQIANARLVAAAPELLDAVTPFSRLLKEHHQRLSDDQPIYGVGESLITVGDLRRAVNAIAKATGKEQP